MPKSIGLGIWLAICLILVSVAAIPAGPADARERNRTLRLFFSHTGEHGEFTFKRNGRYDRGELRRLNHFLRDWRRNEDANMDPGLLDLIWSIHNDTGSRQEIHVVSAYRSPATNAALRARSSGVAKNSQHTLGKAMDFYIPGVPISELRAAAMRRQGGGVGYYPSSGSPFVHVDVGNVRSWPRMTRSQLLALFPNGDTLYLPADGTPLPGYQRALARRQSSGGTELAYLETEESDSNGRQRNGGGWLSRVFGGGDDEEEETEVAAAEADAAPAPPPPAAVAEQAVAALPEILPPRAPRPRPATEMEAMVANAAIDPALAAIPVEEQLAMASIAEVPLPRSRPDTALMAESLDAEAAPALQTPTETELAALAADAQQNLVIAAQNAASETNVVLPSEADSAVITGFAVLEQPMPAGDGTALAAANAMSESAPVPQPRPLALAFAGSGLPAAEPPQAPVAASAPAAAAPAPAPAAAVPSAGELADYSSDARSLELMLGGPAIQDGARLTMPQPAQDPDLFAVPVDATGVPAFSEERQLPANHFQLADASGEESFFSRLFASLAQ